MNEEQAIAALFERLLAGDDLDAIYQRFENAQLINRVVVQRYHCSERRGEVLATVINVQGRILVRTAAYKNSRGKNLATSVEEARLKNTLDGDRHWPGATYDVRALSAWPAEGGAHVECRHVEVKLHGARVLEDIAGRTPGRPGPPIFL